MNQEPTNQAAVDGHVFVSHASDDAAVANSIVDNLEQHGINRGIAPRGFPYLTAMIYGFRGESAEAFKWFDRAYAQKDPNLAYIEGEPTLKKLEGDPRYKALLRKMNLPD